MTKEFLIFVILKSVQISCLITVTTLWFWKSMSINIGTGIANASNSV